MARRTYIKFLLHPSREVYKNIYTYIHVLEIQASQQGQVSMKDCCIDCQKMMLGVKKSDLRASLLCLMTGNTSAFTVIIQGSDTTWWSVMIMTRARQGL